MTYAKWYIYLLNIKQKHRILLTAVTAITMSLTWLLLLYLPTKHKVRMLRVDIEQCKKDIEACVITQQGCEKLQDDMSQLQRDVDLDYRVANSPLQHNLAALVHEIEQAGLQLIALKKQNQKEKSWYKSVYVQLSVKGSMEHLMGFFERLPQDISLVQCSNLIVQKELNDMVSAQCMLKFFVSKQEVQMHPTAREAL